MDIPYDVNTKLVRGLDDYNHMVFEVTVRDSYALGGGGRYNGLVETLGGPSVPGVGFAMGYDRTLLAMEEEGVNVPINNSVDVYLLAVSESEKETACYLAQNLRLNGFIADTDLMNKSLKAQFKSVDRFDAKYLIVLNDEDLQKNEVVIKDNKTKEEERVNINDLVDYIDMHM
jgi:histidyl-tRNA synthetase